MKAARFPWKSAGLVLLAGVLISGGDYRLLAYFGLGGNLESAFLFPALLFVALWLFSARANFRENGLPPLRLEHGRQALAALGLAFPAALALRLLLPELDAWYAPYSGLDSWSGLAYGLAFWIPLAVLKEEVAVRGVVQSRLQKLIPLPYAVGGAALFFALIHLALLKVPGPAAYGWASMAFLLISSAVLTLLYYATGSLAASFLMHLLFNFISALQSFLHVSGNAGWEAVAWGAWGLVFLLTAKREKALLEKARALAGEQISPGWKGLVFLLLLLAVPLAMLLP